MGADLRIYTVAIDTNLKAWFKRQRDKDRAYNGTQDGYSGDLQTVEGVLEVNRSFDTSDEAYKYFEKHCVKWGDALAVRVRDEPAFKSTTKTRRLVAQIGTLDRQVGDLNAALLKKSREKVCARKRGFVTCASCKSKVNVKVCVSATCPVCRRAFVSKADLQRIDRLRAKLAKAREKYQAAVKEQKTKLAKKSKGFKYMVGAMCAC